MPWFAEGEYAETAEKRWQGQVSWRTATAYDATQAVIRALQAGETSVESAEALLANLKQPAFSVPEDLTSGEPIFFDSNGNRKVKPILVKVQEGVPGPLGTSFGFTLMP